MLAKPSLPRDSSAAREGIILLFDGLESNEDVDIPSWGAPGDPHELEMALFERRGCGFPCCPGGTQGSWEGTSEALTCARQSWCN